MNTDVDSKVAMTDSTTAASPATTDTAAAPREVRLASRPVGWPTHADFEVVDSELPDLADGQIRVRNTVMSVDPYMRSSPYCTMWLISKPNAGS